MGYVLVGLRSMDRIAKGKLINRIIYEKFTRYIRREPQKYFLQRVVAF